MEQTNPRPDPKIRDLLKLSQWDKEFSTKRMQNGNPFAKFVMVDAFIVPVKSLLEEYQKAARQAKDEEKDI